MLINIPFEGGINKKLLTLNVTDILNQRYLEAIAYLHAHKCSIILNRKILKPLPICMPFYVQ